jgi:hypothetical protein
MSSQHFFFVCVCVCVFQCWVCVKIGCVCVCVWCKKRGENTMDIRTVYQITVADLAVQQYIVDGDRCQSEHPEAPVCAQESILNGEQTNSFKFSKLNTYGIPYTNCAICRARQDQGRVDIGRIFRRHIPSLHKPHRTPDIHSKDGVCVITQFGCADSSVSIPNSKAVICVACYNSVGTVIAPLCSAGTCIAAIQRQGSTPCLGIPNTDCVIQRT